MKPQQKTKLAKPLLFLLWMTILGILIWQALQRDISLAESPALLREWVTSFGIWGPLVYIITYTIRPLTFFPATILTTVSGLAFGPLYGTLYTIIGANLSATASFLVGRFFAKGLFQRLAQNPKLKAFDCSMRDNGFLAILIMRLIFLPFDLVGFLAGACDFRYRDFALGTFIGILPGSITFILLGSSFMDPRHLIFSGIMFVLGLVIARVLKHKNSLQKLKK